MGTDIAYWYRMPSIWRRRITKDCIDAVPASPDVLADRNYWRAVARAICNRQGAESADGRSEPMHDAAVDV